MVCTILLAGILGTLIPLLLNRLNIDPAVASGIFLHTLTDVISFFSFLGLATFFMSALET
jgi:magnesium transporter